MPPELPEVDELLTTAVGGIGGSTRPGQHVMADRVATAFDKGEHLLVQAGTGTGKSLAYLVPMVRHAVEKNARAVVSTATLALQAQVVERDLPRLAKALKPSLGRELTFQMVKGRANYLCKHKLVGGFPEEDDAPLFDLEPLPGKVVTDGASSRLGREIVRLREWADQTDSGDRDELLPGVSERAWRQVSVNAFECLGSQACPMAAECYSELARARAHTVDVVVTNHALLAIDTFEGRQILPEHDALVVDEAHELADRVTSVISDQLSVTAIEIAASRARRHGSIDTDRLSSAADELELALEPLESGRFSHGLPSDLQAAVEAVRDAAREGLTQLKDATPGKMSAGGDSAAGGLQMAKGALSDVFDTAERLAAGLATDVAWLTVSDFGRGAPRRLLNVAPISVSNLLQDKMFGNRSVVMTSATLTVGGTFDAAARSVGLGSDSAPAWEGIDVGSPFDYQKQSILYVASRLPAPGRDPGGSKSMDELAALVTAAGGRTLGLFSSRRGAEEAAEEMRGRLPFPVLCQGDDSMPNLVRAFAADAETCLFGTLSLWQGVDVPGPACQLVVIDRVPFPRPDDPLMSARTEAVAKSGGNGFMTVSAHHAALRLAQGAGRLIRSTEDRGVVAVLDSRLATARYAGYLQSSLPPMWATTDTDAVLAALRRLDERAGPVWPVAGAPSVGADA